MITRSDNPPLTTEQVATRRRFLVIVCVIIAFAAGYYFYARHEAAKREARRSAIQAKINQLRGADQWFALSSKTSNQAWAAFHADVAAAAAAGRARHDDGVGSNPSDETSLMYAKIESEKVDAAVSDFQTIKDGYIRAQATDEVLFGADAVQKYRADAQTYTTALSISFADWTRAIRRIVDDETIAVRDGSSVDKSDDSDIERDYQMSDEETSRANEDFVPLRTDIGEMRALRASRLRQLETDLAAVR